MGILNQVPTTRFQFEDQESGLRLDIAIQGVSREDYGFRFNDNEPGSRSRSNQRSMTNIMMKDPSTMLKI